MVYYIPIHIDNIDNVISSESIAPIDFYPDKTFGYHHFKPLKDIPNGKEVYLFKRCPRIFDSDDEAVDNVVYIELNAGEQLTEMQTSPFDDGVRVLEPIAIYPWNCRFLFLTDEAMRQAIVMCRSSLCNKMWEYYGFDLLDSKPTFYYAGRFQGIVSEVTVDLKPFISEETKLNRLKGFLYAYTMGRYASLSQPLANLLQAEKKLYDIATTMDGLQLYEANNFSNQLTDLEDIYEQNDPNRIELQRKWRTMIENRFKTAEDREAFESVIKELGSESLMKTNFAKACKIEVRSQLNIAQLRYINWKQYKKELEDYTQWHLASFRMKKGDTNTRDDFSVAGTKVVMNSKYGSFYGHLITTIIAGAEWISKDNIRLHRLDVATEVTRMVRDQMQGCGIEWESSKERSFLNTLRQHIALSTPFDINAAPSSTIKGIAIFLLKGDDFEEMLRYMEYSGQSDYRFALGLWGACVGYTDMPKTAIRRMKLDFRGEDNIYLSTCQYLTNMPNDVKLTRHVYQLQRKQQAPNSSLRSIQDILKTKSLGLNSDQQLAILDMWRGADGKIGEAFWNSVSSIKGIGKVKLKKLKVALSQETENRIKQADMFEEPLAANSRRIDMTAWQYIEPLLPTDPIVRIKVKDDLQWFLGKAVKSNDNRRIISDYKKHLYQKAHPRNARSIWTAEYFGGLNVERIITRLEQIFI